MRSIVLFEDEGFENLLPLVFWRSVFELRLGRKIILDRTAQRLNSPIAGVWTRDWIARVAAQRCGAPANHALSGPAVLVNGRWLIDASISFPDEPCVGMIGDEVAYVVCDAKLASVLAPQDLLTANRRAKVLQATRRCRVGGRMLQYLWEVVDELPRLLVSDWDAADAAAGSKVGKKLCLGPADSVHVGERVKLHPTAVIDAKDGPIFISDDVTIGPHAVIEGPAYLGPGSRVSPHAWLHGGVATGPVVKIGGEVCTSVLSGYSNKQHLGFLGHAFVGNWVNIGAGATNSNLKNTYGRVRVPINGRETDCGLQFFGAIIADHAKIGINTAIPTGAVIGFAANIATAGPAPKYVPSFGWVTPTQAAAGDHRRALDVAKAVMARRSIDMTNEEVELFLKLGEIVHEHELRSSATS
jgi:UDP-N-acetylglucosamine diphosphorylase/glucosamine-1-phosphate N-acetyltransferase